MDIKEMRSEYERRVGQRNQIEVLINGLDNDIGKNTKVVKRMEKAREILRDVGLKTQQKLSFHISDITSLALESVFENPYGLKVDFLQRRNKTECDLIFTKGGEDYDPLTATGGGAVDVAAFALRIASWSMENPKSRPVILLDEPFRFLSEDLQNKASEMLKEISKKLSIQFIIITHNTELASHADKSFNVSLKNRISKVN